MSFYAETGYCYHLLFKMCIPTIWREEGSELRAREGEEGGPGRGNWGGEEGGRAGEEGGRQGGGRDVSSSSDCGLGAGTNTGSDGKYPS